MPITDIAGKHGGNSESHAAFTQAKYGFNQAREDIRRSVQASAGKLSTSEPAAGQSGRERDGAGQRSGRWEPQIQDKNNYRRLDLQMCLK